ncbi:hypothetical protein L208DRAFT_1339635, partial [Tricholoma matsutake]
MGVYHFHASFSAYAEFWNDAIGKQSSVKVSRDQVWHSFVQESIRSLASSSGIDLELADGLALYQVTKQAFEILGEKGIIRAAENHHCSECTQKYKARADTFSLYDAAATVGADENALVPQLEGGIGEIQELLDSQPIQSSGATQASTQTATNGNADVRMMVLDGMVVGPSYCAYDNCERELENSWGG